MTDQITFTCSECGHPVEADLDNLPTDDEEFLCRGCGESFGTYGDFKKNSVELAKKEMDDLIEKHLGVKPEWTKT